MNSEDVLILIVSKLEQHCNTGFALTRAFKVFDKDMSNSIDKDEMRAVLITFSIELTDKQVCLSLILFRIRGVLVLALAVCDLCVLCVPD